MPEVLIPWRGGCPWRERALEFVRSRYGWPVTIAPAPDGVWCKAAAVMPAVEASSADVLVIADADVFVDDGLDLAVEAVEQGAPWAIPHRLLHRLTEAATEDVLARADWHGRPLAQRPYVGYEGGGIVVARRETLLASPLDPRFEGWGQEDEAWALALRTLAGEPWRGDADLVHLWHPPQVRESRRVGSRASWTLFERYQAASSDPDVMRVLVEEVSPCPSPA